MPRTRLTRSERLYRIAKVTPLVRRRAGSIRAVGKVLRARKIAEFILKQPDHLIPKHGKKLGFGRSAHDLLKRGPQLDALPCLERTNAAISLLRASGISAWLARGMAFDLKENSWFLHDMVEFEAGKKMYSLSYDLDYGKLNFHLNEGLAENNWGKADFFLRGADSKQIGGVGSYAEYKDFNRKMTSRPLNELEKNRRRIQVLVEHGVISPRVARQLFSMNKIAVEFAKNEIHFGTFASQQTAAQRRLP